MKKVDFIPIDKDPIHMIFHAERWEEIPDEDLWEDGELSLLDVMHKIEDKLLVEGDWKLIRRKENDNRKKKK